MDARMTPNKERDMPRNNDPFNHIANDARRKVERLERRWKDLQQDLDKAPHDSREAYDIETQMDRVECDIYEAQARLEDLSTEGDGEMLATREEREAESVRRAQEFSYKKRMEGFETWMECGRDLVGGYARVVVALCGQAVDVEYFV